MHGTLLLDRTRQDVEYEAPGTVYAVSGSKVPCGLGYPDEATENPDHTIASHMAQATLSSGSRSHLVHVLFRDIPFILNIKKPRRGAGV